LAEGHSSKRALAFIIFIALLGTCSALILSWTYPTIKEPIKHRDVFEISFNLRLLTDKKTYQVGEPVKTWIMPLGSARSNNESLGNIFIIGPINYTLTIYYLNQTVHKAEVYEEPPPSDPFRPETLYPKPATYTWSQRDSMNHQVQPGVYTIEVKIAHHKLTATTSIVIEK